MAKKESLITGVDIGSHAVKICQLQKTGKGYKVLAVGTASIPAGAVEDGVLQEPEVVSKALAALLKKPGALAWDEFTVPMSMREVEPGVQLIMDASKHSSEPPSWKPKVKKANGGDA